jgi:hypothetical protein
MILSLFLRLLKYFVHPDAKRCPAELTLSLLLWPVVLNSWFCILNSFELMLHNKNQYDNCTGIKIAKFTSILIFYDNLTKKNELIRM